MIWIIAIPTIIFSVRWFVLHAPKYWAGEQETLREKLDTSFWISVAGVVLILGYVFWFMFNS